MKCVFCGGKNVIIEKTANPYGVGRSRCQSCSQFDCVETVTVFRSDASDVNCLLCVRNLIQHIGDDPDREGVIETPARVLKAYKEMFSGYKKDPKDVLKTFSSEKCDELVICRGIEFTSTCEHHLLPFIGIAHIGYVPDGKVLGLSKFARLLEIFTARLQIQERIGEQVTDALMSHLQPKGAACVIESRHLCMACRGVKQKSSTMITSSIKGVLTGTEARAEFMSLIRGTGI